MTEESKSTGYQDIPNIFKIIGIILYSISTCLIFMQYVNIYVIAFFYSVDIMMFDIKLTNILYSCLIGIIIGFLFFAAVVILMVNKYTKEHNKLIKENNQNKTEKDTSELRKSPKKIYAVIFILAYVLLTLMPTMSQLSYLNIFLNLIIESVMLYALCLGISTVFIKLFFKDENNNTVNDIKILKNDFLEIKNKMGLFYYIFSILISALFCICTWVLVNIVIQYLSLFYKFDKNYYITEYSDKSYIIINQNSNNVIGVKCSIDKDDITIYMGEYKIIKSNDIDIKKQLMKNIKYK